jgi:hypothetical protein
MRFIVSKRRQRPGCLLSGTDNLRLFCLSGKIQCVEIKAFILSSATWHALCNNYRVDAHSTSYVC